MRLAKLDYLKNSSPAFTNPYYWAAYEVLGDNAPVTQYMQDQSIIVGLVVIIAAGMSLFILSGAKYFLTVPGRNHLILPDIQSIQLLCFVACFKI